MSNNNDNKNNDNNDSDHDVINNLNYYSGGTEFQELYKLVHEWNDNFDSPGMQQKTFQQRDDSYKTKKGM